MAKSKKATWIILLAMLGYGCLLLGAATSVRAAECKKTSDADDIKNVKGTGKACTEKEAMQAAFDNLGDRATCAVRTLRVLNPGSTCKSRQTLCIMSPAPESNMTAKPTSTATKMPSA